MSIFKKIKGAKKAAKDHKQAQQGNAAENVDKPIPYKHVPTHAAIDAMAGAPASYREADRAEIMATNEKRRSLAQSNRNSSTMSGTLLDRNSSYGSTSNYSYSRPMPPRLEARRSYGAQGGYYNSGQSTGYQTFQPSPLASKGPSPNGSLNESSSSSSSHLVEMQYAAPATTSHLMAPPHTTPASSSYGMASPQTAPGPSSYTAASSLTAPGPSTYGAASSLSAPGPSTYAVAPTYNPPAQKRFEQTMMETIHGNQTRKLGEAPLLAQPPPSQTKPVVAPTPVQTKKRSWGFGKRNSHSTAIAAH